MYSNKKKKKKKKTLYCSKIFLEHYVLLKSRASSRREFESQVQLRGLSSYFLRFDRQSAKTVFLAQCCDTCGNFLAIRFRSVIRT